MRSALVTLLTLVALGGCADMDAAGAWVNVPGLDAGPETGFGIELEPPEDSDASSDAQEPDSDVGPEAADGAGAASTKDDEVFVVPAAVSTKTGLALGPAGAAWVERVEGGGLKLGLWPLGEDGATGEPTYFALPVGVDPRGLQVGEHWLVYTDTPYGDRDLFGIHLQTGQSVTLAGQLHDQSRPALRAGVLAWQDCRDCVVGGPLDGKPEIYRRTLGAGVGDIGLEERVTNDGIADETPALGTLGNGAAALSWVKAETNMRVSELASDGFDDTFDVVSPLDGIALTQGVLAFRPSPFIINPDSMMPVDVYLLDVATETQSSISVHSELWPTLPVPPVADGGRVAWLESIPSEGLVPQRVRIADVTAPDAQPQTLKAEGVTGIALHGGWVGFTAPREDNGGALDVWLLKLDTP